MHTREKLFWQIKNKHGKLNDLLQWAQTFASKVPLFKLPDKPALWSTNTEDSSDTWVSQSDGRGLKCVFSLKLFSLI